MKKVIILAIVLAMTTASFAGCNSSSTTSSKDDTTSSVSSQVDEKDVKLVYGYMPMTFAEYWASELGGNVSDFEKSSDKLDAEGYSDTGMYDAVTRPTTKHGIYRMQIGYTVEVTGEKITNIKTETMDGKEKTTYETDKTATKTVSAKVDYKGVVAGEKGDKFDLVACEDSVLIDDMAQYFEIDGDKYKITSMVNSGLRNVAVAIPEDKAKDVEGFVESSEVTADSYGLKTMDKDGNFGKRNTDGKAKESSVVADTDALKYAYNTHYGSDAELYCYLKNADGSELSSEQFLDYAAHFQTAKYEYFGNDSTYKNLVATYGSKCASDSWWSTNHGSRIDLGINYSYDRFKDSGVGFYKITLISDKYADVVVECEFKSAYDKEITATMKGDKLTFAGLDEKMMADQTVTISSGTTKADFAYLVEDEKVSALENTLSKSSVAGTEYTVTLTLADFQPVTLKVTAE